jgi:hypothetical protein
MKIVSHAGALLLLAVALSCLAFGQEEHLTYVVTAFFVGLDKPEESLLYAHRLSEKIEGEGLRGSMEAGKKPWDCCFEKHEKPMLHCAAIYAKIDIGFDKAKNVHLYVIEGKDEGEVTKDLSCDPSQTNESCFNDLLARMAKAVKSYHEQCHAGKKCRSRNMQFVAE